MNCSICDEAINSNEDAVTLGSDKSLAHPECAQDNGYCECENCKEYFDSDNIIDDEGVNCCEKCLTELNAKHQALFGLDKKTKFIKLILDKLKDACKPVPETELREELYNIAPDPELLDNFDKTLRNLEAEGKVWDTPRGWQFRHASLKVRIVAKPTSNY